MARGNLQRGVAVFAALLTVLACLTGCSSAQSAGTAGSADAAGAASKAGQQANAADTSRFLRITNDEPDTADPQCTDYYYDIPLNVFDRLIEVQVDEDGASSFAPSLADSWEVSDDGLVYTFHLHEGVTFSNGSPLTSSDVEYTFVRALTHPDSRAGDIGAFIQGADELQSGEAEGLEGFEAIDDLDFTITLSSPYAAFLAILSTPAASILGEEATSAAGDDFGKNPQATIGTGPFTFREWNAGKDVMLAANPSCWSGAPGCDGIVMQFVTDSEAKRLMFEQGELDILDLENMGTDAEYFIRGDIYKGQLRYGRRVGLTYIALNESVEPLDDVRVRRALQLALDRDAILMNVYSGRGSLENGIYPHGLIGFNADLPEIPHDLQEAAALLEEAGYPDGFDLEAVLEEGSMFNSKEILDLAAYMWGKIGVRTTVATLDARSYDELRKSGKAACYARRFSVDFNDPDAIAYVFFGSAENTRLHSLCYGNEDVIDRVNDACSIVDEQTRLEEYQELEKVIVQEDCAWIPLFSNQHYFVVNERVKNFQVSWNGWTDTQYRDVVIED